MTVPIIHATTQIPMTPKTESAEGDLKDGDDDQQPGTEN